jgi:hypothetical protein
MKHDTVAQMFQRFHANKKNGVKHSPLHTLQECCEEAGIDPRAFGRYAAQYPDAPKPVLHHAKNVGRGAVKYYRKHEFVQWVKQVRQQKEKAMPDIKTALKNALAQTADAWAADDEAHQKIEPQQEKTMTLTAPTKTSDFRITTNVSRATFYFVRDNPGMNNAQITLALMGQGYKATSVSSLLGQMQRVRLLVADQNGCLSATVREYAPIQAAASRRRKNAAAPAPAKHKQVTIVNTRTGEVINPKPAPAAGITALRTTPAEWTVDSVIGSLNVRQAMAVYAELRGIFGDVK